jgi:hypothetical protein
LNDELVNVGIGLTLDQLAPAVRKRIHQFPTQFFLFFWRAEPLLNTVARDAAYNRVKKWTKKLKDGGLFGGEVDMIIVPFGDSNNSHWTALVSWRELCPVTSTPKYYVLHLDSLSEGGAAISGHDMDVAVTNLKQCMWWWWWWLLCSSSSSARSIFFYFRLQYMMSWLLNHSLTPLPPLPLPMTHQPPANKSRPGDGAK